MVSFTVNSTNSFCKRFSCAKYFLLYSSDIHHLDNKSANIFSEEGIYVALICTLCFEHKTKFVAPNLTIYDPYQHQQLKAAHRLDCHKEFGIVYSKQL